MGADNVDDDVDASDGDDDDDDGDDDDGNDAADNVAVAVFCPHQELLISS